MTLSVYVANLSAVVQIRMPSETTGADDARGEWWKSVAAFVSHQRAEDYANDCRKYNPKKFYRVIDL